MQLEAVENQMEQINFLESKIPNLAINLRLSSFWNCGHTKNFCFTLPQKLLKNQNRFLLNGKHPGHGKA